MSVYCEKGSTLINPQNHYNETFPQVISEFSIFQAFIFVLSAVFGWVSRLSSHLFLVADVFTKKKVSHKLTAHILFRQRYWILANTSKIAKNKTPVKCFCGFVSVWCGKSNHSSGQLRDFMSGSQWKETLFFYPVWTVPSIKAKMFDF